MDDSDPTFELLHRYLDDLHHGRAPDRSALLRDHPGLGELLDCVESLDRLAPPPEPPSAPDATVVFSDGVVASGTAPSSTPAARTRFGKYQLEGELGRGGMGVVYKAVQVDLGRPVAIKMILANHLASADLLGRFQDEARAAAGLNHPHIVTVYEAGQIDGQPYFAMQYVAGSCLSQRLRDGPLPPDEAARIVLAIARAVEHLHAHGIVHRDLKPSNILLDDDGQPYVTDFGLVKLLDHDSHRTSTGAIVGTASYMSPEQAAGKVAQVGPLSDVYSLGAILYESLTGRPPFHEESPLDTLVQVLESDPVPPRQIRKDIPPDLELIALRCLEKSPADRFASAGELARTLDSYLKGEETGVTLPGVGYQLRRWARREPALVSRYVTLLLCFVIAQTSYQFVARVSLVVHAGVLGSLAAWGAASYVCQRLMNTKEWSEPARYLWAGIDVLFFSFIVYVTDDIPTPVIIGYPLLIVASGLWFRVPLVWYTAGLSLLSYLVLLTEWAARTGPVEGLHKNIIFMVGLAVLAFITAYQVHRVRALSKYYECRKLP
jgi:serine/threonine-protein kinase